GTLVVTTAGLLKEGGHQGERVRGAGRALAGPSGGDRWHRVGDGLADAVALELHQRGGDDREVPALHAGALRPQWLRRRPGAAAIPGVGELGEEERFVGPKHVLDHAASDAAHGGRGQRAGPGEG